MDIWQVVTPYHGAATPKELSVDGAFDNLAKYTDF